ncbi:MAG: SLOG family protein [Alistipes sp.]
MNFDRTQTVAFTGHRTYDGRANAALLEVLQQLYTEGFRTFMSGMAVGFDLAAAEAVEVLRAAHTDVQLLCAVPFVGQERHFSPADQVRYRALLARADEVIYVCESYCPECYALRNNWLVDRASVVVAWYVGSAGGTRQTVQRARRAQLRIENLWIDPQQKLPGL